MEQLWTVWSSALEEAAGISYPLRQKGSVVHSIETVRKGPCASRMNHQCRRLHRVWRRACELQRQLALNKWGPALFQTFLRNIQVLQKQGLLEDVDVTDVDCVEEGLRQVIFRENQNVEADRFAQWTAVAKAPGLAN